MIKATPPAISTLGAWLDGYAWPRRTSKKAGRRFNMRDDLTIKRLAGQLLRGVKAVHEENNPGRPLGPGAPVRPHVAAERIGISPVGHRYAATLAYLEEQGALD